jgi:hypothetical protein
MKILPHSSPLIRDFQFTEQMSARDCTDSGRLAQAMLQSMELTQLTTIILPQSGHRPHANIANTVQNELPMLKIIIHSISINRGETANLYGL